MAITDADSAKKNVSVAEHSPRNQAIIGTSEQGRPLNVVFVGKAKSKIKIFVIAGQHGDELNGREAALRLASSPSRSIPGYPSSVQLAILLDANPDGSNLLIRNNSSQIDLNRDHQRLDAKETRAIHDFVRRWRPHMTVDVHNYPSRRKHLLAENHVIDYDVLLDTPTNPAVYLFPNQEAVTEDLVRSVCFDLNSLGFSCGRYLLFKSSSRARGSTLDLVDARNSLALRYESLTVLLEGRNPTKDDDDLKRENLVSAQYQALLSIIRWARDHPDSLTFRAVAKKGTVVPIRYKYHASMRKLNVKYKNTLSGQSETLPLQVYSGDVRILQSVTLPSAYAIPENLSGMLQILDRHGFSFSFSETSRVEELESYTIDGSGMRQQEEELDERASQIGNLLVTKVRRKLLGYRIYRTDQLGGKALSLFLEPGSRYGLMRHHDLRISLFQRNRSYPVLRIP